MGLLLTATGVMATDSGVRAPGDYGPASIGVFETEPQAAQLVLTTQSGATLSAARTDTGAIAIRIVSQGLDVRKIVRPDGGFLVRLRVGADLVTALGDQGRLTVSRRGRTVVLEAATISESRAAEARALLAQSPAVRQFRAMVTALTPEDIANPAWAGFLVTATYFSLLDGDTDAARRMAIRAQTARRAASEFEGGPACYDTYQIDVVGAFNDYEICVNSFGWWNPMSELCLFEWVLRAESAWFTFLGCSSFPVK